MASQNLISLNFDPYQSDNIRIIKDDLGNFLFCLADVCAALELTNPSIVAEQIKDEFSTPKLNLGMITRPDNSKISVNFITEPQLYFVMMRSRSAVARKFRQWIVNEVLPALHSKGYYAVPGQQTPKQDDKEEKLDNATMTALRKYIWELGRVTWYEQSFSNAVWCALRKATNTPSPQVFAIKDVDKLIEVLRKVTGFVASYYNFKNNTEKELFRKIIAEGAPLAELDSELAKFQIEEKECKDFTRSFNNIESIFNNSKLLLKA